MEKKDIDSAVLQRYLQGVYSAQDLAKIREYLSNDDYTESLSLFMDADWKQMMEADVTGRVRYKANRFLSSVRSSGIMGIKPVHARVRWLHTKGIRSLAAAAVAGSIILAGVLMVATARRQSGNNDKWISVANTDGRKKTLILPDSSQVFLGRASAISYNHNFGISNRELRLEGEAYFIVRHGGVSPFSIVTGPVTTIDIGTEFNIRHVAGEHDIEVSVASGSVDVLSHHENGAEKITRLNSLQRLTYDNARQTLLLDTVHNDEIIGGWRSGLLSFREKTLEEVAHELERYYDMEVRFLKSENKEALLTTTLDNATVDEAIDIISITAGVSIKRSGRLITIQ